MKAVVYTHNGSPDVLQIKDIELPRIKENQVLIKIHAASVNALDSHSIHGLPSFMRVFKLLSKPKPQTPGVDLAGKVEAIGKQVSRFKIGDEVFGVAHGAFAEYAAANENNIAHKPANKSFNELAVVPVAAITALQALRDHGKIKPGQKVLIQGAGGGVGIFAVQIAKILGAEVTAVCSERNAEIVRSIGADYVFDYSKEDFTRAGNNYDLILVINGYRPISDYRKVLNPSGTVIMIGATKSKIFKVMFQFAFLGSLFALIKKQKFKFFIARINPKDLECLKDWVQSGQLKAVIDRQFSLVQTVDAIRYLEEGHVKGKISIAIL